MKNREQRMQRIEGKTMPHSKPLEEAVLGAALVDSQCLPTVLELVMTDDIFYYQQHQYVFRAISQLYARSESVDMLTVTQELRKMGTLERAGGAFAVASLCETVNSAAHIESHIRKLQEAYMKREIIRCSEESIAQAFDTTSDPLELVAQLSQSAVMLTALLERRGEQAVGTVLQQCLQELAEKAKQVGYVTGVPCACNSVNQITGGWQKSDLIVLAARPGMGKTAFAINDVRIAATKFGIPCAIFSLEMSATQLVNRYIASESEISGQKLRQPNELSTQDFVKITNNVAKLYEAPIYIDDTPGLTILEIRAKAKKMWQKYGIQMIVVDYLQLVSNPTIRNREQEISSITRQLKQLAKELHVPVIALSQLSRSVEQRGGDKRPMLSDLRESGAIEQDADVVVFLYRPEYYGITEDEVGNPTRGLVEVIIAKHRAGSVEDVFVEGDLPTNRFGDLGTLSRHRSEFAAQQQEGEAAVYDINAFSTPSNFERKDDEEDPF